MPKNSKRNNRKGVIHIPLIVLLIGLTFFGVILLTSLNKNPLQQLQDPSVQGVQISPDKESGLSGSPSLSENPSQPKGLANILTQLISLIKNLKF